MTAATLRDWCLEFATANVALVMPPDIVGIDVDAYDGKRGLATIADLEARLGVKLPPTYVSTARDDGSGIRFYRVPPGLQWPGNLGDDSGVDIIWCGDRYAVVAPSMHPKVGKPYRWISPDGVDLPAGRAPAPEEITAALQPEFVEELTSGRRYTVRGAGRNLDISEAMAWLEERGGTDEPCEGMARTLSHWLPRMQKAQSSTRHDTARQAVWAVVQDAGQGHRGAAKVLREGLYPAWVSVAGTGRDKEFMSLIPKAVGQQDDPEEDVCELFAEEMQVSTQDGAVAVPEGSYTYDDVGNSRRLLDALAGDGKFIEAWGEWVLYDGDSALWVRDPGSYRLTERMIALTDRMRSAASRSDDPKRALSWATTSRGAGKLRAAVDLAKGRSLGRAEEFDVDPRALHAANGVVELLPAGAKYRPRARADMATLSAPAPYRPWDELRRTPEAREWLAFLRRVQPNEDDRRWLQTLAGYSLLGRNPERAFVLAIGPTSSGKTTFAEAIRGAVGEYVGVVNLSLFRDKQDEGPRADLVEALAKRLVYAVETSAHAVLHAENVKRLTGGDPLKARRLHSNVMVERIPAFTPWLLTNETPTVPGADQAVHRRLVAVRFGVSLAPHEIDVSLPGRLAAPEARLAILAWVVDGWDLYCRDGLREAPASAMEARQDAINAMSTLDLFLNECCETGPADDGYTVTSADLHARYQDWLLDSGVEDRRTASKPAFGRAIGAHGYSRVKTEGGAVRAWGGLRLAGSVRRTDRIGPRRGPTDRSED